jgi:hypothetical protein
MTQHEQEKYVRSRWVDVYDCGGFVRIYSRLGQPLFTTSYSTRKETWQAAYDGQPLFTTSYSTRKETWQAAYDFTVDREEEIRQVEREASVMAYAISALREQINDWCTLPGVVLEQVRTLCAMCRTLARLDQKLTELKREMKETA